MNQRRKQFVEAYVASGNATEAAKQAGYSARTAHAQGSRLLRKAEIQTAIQHRRDALANSCEVTPEKVRDRLWLEARGLGQDTSPGARVTALSSLTKCFGMQIEKREIRATVATPRISRVLLRNPAAQRLASELLEQVANLPAEEGGPAQRSMSRNGAKRGGISTQEWC